MFPNQPQYSLATRWFEVSLWCIWLSKVGCLLFGEFATRLSHLGLTSGNAWGSQWTSFEHYVKEKSNTQFISSNHVVDLDLYLTETWQLYNTIDNVDSLIYNSVSLIDSHVSGSTSVYPTVVSLIYRYNSEEYDRLLITWRLSLFLDCAIITVRYRLVTLPCIDKKKN